MPRDSGDLGAIKLAVGMYVVVFAAKLAAFYLTGVIALLAEAFHTFSDILISAFLLAAAAWSRREADAGHMFGHARAQNVAALVAATLFLSFTSFRLYEEAIPRLFEPAAATYRNLEVALAVLALSMVAAAVPLVRLLRQKGRTPAAKAQFRELINDELGLLAALVGTLFIAWGQPLADPIATILVATVIAFAAVDLFRENASLLLGGSPGPEFMEALKSTALSVRGVRGLHKVTAEYIGPGMVHAELHVEVDPTMTIEEADRVSVEVDRRIREATGCEHLVLHFDPAAPDRTSP